MARIVKSVKVEATFPSGRIVTGVSRFPPQLSDKPFQVFDGEDSIRSTIINPLLAETIRIHITYED